MTKRYRVREFAELAGVTCKTLRHYDRLEVLKPTRTAAGYRTYTEQDLRRLERIVALKFLGLPLRQIRRVLDDSDDAWEKLTRLGEQYAEARQSRLLAEAVCEAKSLLGEDPAGDKAQELCRRWSQLWQSTTGGDPGVLAGIRKAWADRANWLPEIEHSAGNFDEKSVGDFISKAFAASMKKYYTDRAWARKSAFDHPDLKQAWQALFQDVRTALNADPSSKKGRDLAKRWRRLWEVSTQDDPEIREGMKHAWQGRGDWPYYCNHMSSNQRYPRLPTGLAKRSMNMARTSVDRMGKLVAREAV